MNRNDYVHMFNLLQRTRTRYAECVKITRTDGEIFRFTAHDNNLTIAEPGGGDGVYLSANSFVMTNLETTAGLAVSNMDIDALVDDDSITEEDLRTGKFDHAQVDLFLAYWNSRETSILPLRKSWIGELQIDRGKFKVDLRGLAQKLAQKFVNATSLECRYWFCDSDCKLSEASFTDNYTVTSVDARDQFSVAVPGDKEDGYYKWGRVEFTSGNNNGQSMEVIHHYGDRVKLFLPVRGIIQVGDTVKLVRGCDKTWDFCKSLSNGVNFGGEPFLAGWDQLVKYPDPGEASKDSEDA